MGDIGNMVQERWQRERSASSTTENLLAEIVNQEIKSHKTDEAVVRLNDLLRAIKTEQAVMTDDERVTLWDDISEGYCRYCGSKFVPCYCLRDE